MKKCLINSEGVSNSFKGFQLTFKSANNELIDNSLQAKATQIHIINHPLFHLFIDNGIGMNKDTLEHKFLTHFSKSETSKGSLGKFGIGGKAAEAHIAKTAYNTKTPPSLDTMIFTRHDNHKNDEDNEDNFEFRTVRYGGVKDIMCSDIERCGAKSRKLCLRLLDMCYMDFRETFTILLTRKDKMFDLLEEDSFIKQMNIQLDNFHKTMLIKNDDHCKHIEERYNKIMVKCSIHYNYTILQPRCALMLNKMEHYTEFEFLIDHKQKNFVFRTLDQEFLKVFNFKNKQKFRPYNSKHISDKGKKKINLDEIPYPYRAKVFISFSKHQTGAYEDENYSIRFIRNNILMAKHNLDNKKSDSPVSRNRYVRCNAWILWKSQSTKSQGQSRCFDTIMNPSVNKSQLCPNENALMAVRWLLSNTATKVWDKCIKSSHNQQTQSTLINTFIKKRKSIPMQNNDKIESIPMQNNDKIESIPRNRFANSIKRSKLVEYGNCCAISGMPFGAFTPVEFDHGNGNRSDNSLQNCNPIVIAVHRSKNNSLYKDISKDPSLFYAGLIEAWDRSKKFKGFITSKKGIKKWQQFKNLFAEFQPVVDKYNDQYFNKKGYILDE